MGSARGRDDARWFRSWRAPALAAFVVAALVTTIAVFAGRGSSDVAAPGAGNSSMDDDAPDVTQTPPDAGSAANPADAVTVVVPTPVVPPTTAIAPTGFDPVTVRVDTGMAGTGAQAMQLWLAGEEAEQRVTPDGTETVEEPLLRVIAVGTDAITDDHLRSDGTPLGYLRVAPSRAEQPNTMDTGGAYLYGVVSPEADRIAVLLSEAPGPSGSYPSSTPTWVVADTGAVVWSPDQGVRVLWTDLAEGWRAVAIQTPAPSQEMTVLAWGADRTLLQARQWSADGSTVTDLPVDTAPELDVWDPLPPEPRFGPGGPNGAGGPFVATFPDIPGQPSLAALLEGHVAVQNGCVVAGIRGGDGTTTLVFPQSQVEPATPPAVLRFRGRDYAEGDPISVGGGSFTMTDRDGIPEGCPVDAWSVSPY